MVEAAGLEKRYPDRSAGPEGRLAVAGIDFTVGAGECFGLLGPNGAGKTTTIRMVTCRTEPSAGRLSVLGRDVREPGAERWIKERLGIVTQEDNLDRDVTVLENLLLYAALFGCPDGEARRRAAENLAFLQLDGREGSRIAELSGGMRRRLVIARALINRPELLVLDEPTTGLDPQARFLVWEKLRLLKERGISILLTTHYMEEAARLCDRVAILDQGRILAEGEPSSLVREIVGEEVLEVRGFAAVAALAGEGADGPLPCSLLRRAERVGEAVHLYGTDADALLAAVQRAGVRPERYLARPASLDDVFLTLTGRELHE